MKTVITHLLLTDSYSVFYAISYTRSHLNQICVLHTLLARLIPQCLCDEKGTKIHSSASSSPFA
jgi:hypothetical protein